MSHSTLSNAPAALRAEPDAVIGEKYKVARLLGEGGMGAVYEAENTWTRRRVAVKVMRPEFARDPEASQRFLREAQSAAQIDHPNVVSVLDMGRDATTKALFIVQEYLVGCELRALLDEKGAMPPEQALELMLPVIDGLVAAHALGVVHRDLKPENIFLVQSRTGRTVPKLIDFGIAKALRPREDEFRTMIGQTMGTPGYMSPEQARGDLDIDARTDVWAIGVVLYEMLSGRIPYEYDDNPQVMLARLIMNDPLPLERAAPAIAPELCAVVHRALQRERGQRYPDMQSFYNALAATPLGGRVRDTLRKAAPVEVSSPSISPPPADAPARAQPDAPIVPEAPVRRSRAPVIVAGVACALGLVALAAELALRAAEPDAPRAPVVEPRGPVAALRGPVAAPRAPVVEPRAPVVAPRAPVVAPRDTVVAPRDTVVAPQPVDAQAGRRPTRVRGHGAQRGANGAAIID
jgi:serine/threonine-protein kinase